MSAKKESIVSFINQKPFQRVRRKIANGQQGTLGKEAIKTSGSQSNERKLTTKRCDEKIYLPS